MKRKKSGLFYHFIILASICQALTFLFSPLSGVKAAANSLKITCPTEISPSESVTCTISSNSTVKINKISGEFSTQNLKISDLKPLSPWTTENSSTNLSVSASSSLSGESQIASFKITATTSDSTGTLLLNNLAFELEEQYAFSVASPLVELTILSAPEITCAEDEELVDGVCKKIEPVCEEDEELIDGTCQKKDPDCADNEELINGVCEKIEPICENDEELVNGICQKKVITPTCKSDEILKDNQCVKKDQGPDFLLIGIIAGSVVVIVGIIILIVILSKRQKGQKSPKAQKQSGSGTYLNLSSSSAAQPNVGNYKKAQNLPPNLKYDNSNYMSRTGDVTETTATPKPNDDPRLQMQIQNPSSSAELQRKTPVTSDDQNNQNATLDPNDPRLQIQFNNTQEAMALKNNTSTVPTTSVYAVANQVTPSQESQPKTVIQENGQVVQPVGPRANQAQSPFSGPIQASQSTTPVELSKPTTPDVFES